MWNAVQTLYLTKCNICSLNGVKTLFLLVFGYKLNTCDSVSRGKWVQFVIRCSGTCCPNTEITTNKAAGISMHALGRENYTVKPVPNYTHFGSRRISSSWDTNWLIFELSILKLTSWCLSRSTWNWYIFLSPNLFSSISHTGLQLETRALLTIGWRKQYKKCNSINVNVDEWTQTSNSLVIILEVLPPTLHLHNFLPPPQPTEWQFFYRFPHPAYCMHFCPPSTPPLYQPEYGNLLDFTRTILGNLYNSQILRFTLLQLSWVWVFTQAFSYQVLVMCMLRSYIQF